MTEDLGILIFVLICVGFIIYDIIQRLKALKGTEFEEMFEPDRLEKDTNESQENFKDV